MEEREEDSGPKVPAIVKFKELVDSPYAHEQFGILLRDEARTARFLRILTSTVASNPDLLNCNHGSVISCAMQGAQLNLDPDKTLGQFYLIPRKGTCTFMLGYQGMIQLALRSQKVRSVVGRVVYRQDEFDAVEGTNGYIKHRRNIDLIEPPDLEEDFRAAYAVAHFVRKNDQPDDFEFVVMPKWQVNRIRDRFSKAKSGPWIENPDGMRAKTAIRQLFKFLQVSAEMNLAIALDEAVDEGLEQPLTTSFDPPRRSSGSKLEVLKDKLTGGAAKAPAEDPVHISPEPVVEQPKEDATKPSTEEAIDVSDDDFVEETVVVPDWASDAEHAAAVKSLREEVAGLMAVMFKADPKGKAKVKEGVRVATRDSLGIFGYEENQIDSVRKHEWADFRDLLISNIQGLSGKIGEGGESELRRKCFVAFPSVAASGEAVAELCRRMNVERLCDVLVLNMEEAESQIAAMKKEKESN